MHAQLRVALHIFRPVPFARKGLSELHLTKNTCLVLRSGGFGAGQESGKDNAKATKSTSPLCFVLNVRTPYTKKRPSRTSTCPLTLDSEVKSCNISQAALLCGESVLLQGKKKQFIGAQLPVTRQNLCQGQSKYRAKDGWSPWDLTDQPRRPRPSSLNP